MSEENQNTVFNVLLLHDEKIERETLSALITDKIIGSFTVHDAGIRYLLSLLHNEDFCLHEHVVIFQTIKWLIDQKKAISFENITHVVTKFSPTNISGVNIALDNIKKVAINENILCNNIVSIILKSQRRKIIQVCQEAIQMCYTENTEPQKIIEHIKNNI